MQKFETAFTDAISEFDNTAKFTIDDVSQITLEDGTNLLNKIVIHTSQNEGVEYGGNVAHKIVGNAIRTSTEFITGDDYVDLLDEFESTIDLIPYDDYEMLATALLVHSHPIGINFLQSKGDLKNMFSYCRGKISLTRDPDSIYRIPLFGNIQTPKYDRSLNEHPFQIILLQDLLAPNKMNNRSAINQISECLSIPTSENPLHPRYNEQFQEYLELLKIYSVAAAVFRGSVSKDSTTLAEFEQTHSNGLAFNTKLYALSTIPLWEDL